MTDFSTCAATPGTGALPPIPDLETRATGAEHQDTRLWLRMLSCCNLIENEVRSRLRTEFKTTLPRFDLMAQLTQAPKGMKMSDLSRLMMVTNGNVTGITDQLEREGLVERLKDTRDRRSSLIRLTTKGRRTYRKLQEAHEAWIRSLLGGAAPATREALYDLLGELKHATYSRLPSC
jgi:DNA-binding MarR family transcriptional regulator